MADGRTQSTSLALIGQHGRASSLLPLRVLPALSLLAIAVLSPWEPLGEPTQQEMREAIGFHVEGLREQGEPVPRPAAVAAALVEVSNA